MGEFRFRVPFEWTLDPYHANSIHIVGIDGVPWPCRIAVGDDLEEPTRRKLLSVSRNRDESGKLYVVYPFEKLGEVLICTGTLPPRPEAYELLTELARGTLNRLRNQVSIWEEGGLQIEKSIHEKVKLAIGWLSESILSEDSLHQDEVAQKSIENSMDAIFDLSDCFGQKISKYRREHEQMSNFWVGTGVGSGEELNKSIECDTFDLVEISLGPESETSINRTGGRDPGTIQKRMIVGPWLDASVNGLKERLVNLDDFQARKDQLLIECRQQVDAIPPTASLLHVVSGLNGLGHRHLSYPQQLQVTIEMLRLIEESRIELPTLVSFDFPWAERLAGAVGGIHPLQIADSLLRQGLQISFLGLDVNLDYWPNGSVLRDPLQWIDLVDVWAQLGLPLVLNLRVPTGKTEAGEELTSPDKKVNQSRSNLTDEQLIEFLDTILPMMVARPSVHGLIWRNWQDGDDPRFPKSGLVDTSGSAKPIGELLTRLRASISGS